MPIRKMTEAEAEAMRKSAAQRRAALSASKNSRTTTSSKTASSKTNFVSPTSLVKNSASNKTSTKTSSKSTTKVNSSPVRSKSSGTTSYFQPKTRAKSKTISGRKTTSSYTPWYRRDRLDMSNRKSSKDRLGGSSAYAEDYLARLLSGMSEKDWFLTNAEQALDFRSLLSNKLLTGENKLTPSQRLAMKSPLNWAQTNANLKRSTGMDLAEFNTKYLGSKLTAEEFAKRQKEDRDYWADQAAKAAEYELSPYDKKLPSTDRQRIQKEKMRWDVANSMGDFETRKTAHKMAETIRARYGYSGGAAGDQKIAADITWQDAAALNALNADGQGKYRMAKLELEQAVKEGNEDRIGAAEEKLSQILANPNYRSGAKPGTQNVTGHDAPMPDTSDNWMDQAAETLKAAGYVVPGSLAFLAETQGQVIDDRVVEENYDYIRSKAAELPTLQARLSLIQQGEGSESWGTEEQLQKQIALAQSMQDLLDSYGQMDQNSLGSQLMAKSQEHTAAALEGTSGLDRLLTQTALSMAQTAPGILLSFVPGIGPVLGLGLMGAQEAGSKEYELNERGVDPAELQLRGIIYGGIASMTEKIPVSNLLKVVKAGGGASLLKSMAKQAGIEATEESISYALDYAADVAFKDPEAKFSMQELLETAAIGGLSGVAFGGIGSAIGSVGTRGTTAPQAAAPTQQQPKTDLEAQTREQALEMLAETAPGREIVPQTEPTTQQAAEAPVQTLRESAVTSPASAGNTQQEQAGKAQASKAQAPSSAAKASPAAKTIKLRRVSGQTQTASPRKSASPKAQGALQQAQTALLTQMSKTLGTSGEKAMLAAWDNSGDPGQYTAGFVRVYNQALSGTTAGKIQAPASLNDAQVMAAYSAGQNDRKLSLEQAREAAQQAEVAKKNASLYASEEGTEAGLVYDSYVQESMDPDTAAALSSVAKQLGLRVQMVDSVAGGMANADIQGSAVQIEKNNPNPVRALFGHELTHRVQQLAPESYQAFRDYVMQSGKAQADVQKKIAEYKRAGVELTAEEAMDEIAADYAGEMIEDQDLLKQFIQKNKENKNVLRRFLEAVKQLASKLTGKYQKQAKDAVSLLEKAVGDASRQAGKLQASKNTAGKGKTKYSVKETDSGELRKLEAVDFSDGQLRKLEAEKFSLKGSDDYQGLIEKYGAIEQGENPRARDVQVPRQTADGKKVSRTVRTVMEAAATPDAMVPTIQEMVEKGEFSYEVAGDKAAIENAEAIIRDKGFQAALMDWTGTLAAGTVSKQNTATGWALYNAAAQAGDVKTAADIMSKLVYHQRNAAQAVQATRILKQMVPGAQLYAIQRSVQNMQDELRSKYGDKAPGLKIPDELVETYLNAESQQERDEAEKEIYISIGKQMPSTFQDKWNAWRYLAMLFNFRTHVRNVVGNAGFAVPVLAKNVVGTALEGIGSAVSGGRMQRTKGVYSPGLFKAAWKDYKNAKPQIMAGGKYDDSVAKRDAIEEGRRIFKNRFLEGLRRFNSGALELEDGWFAQPHYANALAQYCAANKITAEQLETGEGLDQAALDKARAYAIQEAQKATYRDFNDFSDFISSVGRYSGDNKVKKVFSSAVEGVLPFRKTPANILVRAVEYSPIGLIDGMWELTYGVKAGKNTAAEALDRLSAGLTGTGLFSLGVYLAAQGLLVASGDDDDKQKAYDDLLGKQEYAIQLPDGTNFTIDWLAPECIPVFMGAEYFKAMDDRENGGEFSLTMFLDSMSKVTNPLLEMSCLSSLNDLFDNLSGYKTGDVSSLVVVVANMAVSYLTQGVPTLMGQGERSSQEDRVTTYTDKNKDLPSDWQYTLGKVSAKIPGWDYGQIPYIDAWGQKETESSTAKRIVNNFVNPAYTSKFQKDKVEGELQRLYTETGESVLPERAERYFNLGDERVDLTGEQYVTYATEKGQRSYALVSSFVNASYYGSQTDGDRTAAIDMLYTYATEQAKKAVFPEYTSSQSWVEKANAAIEEGVKPEVYIYLYSKTRGVESLKDSKGETIKNSKGLQIMEAVNDSGVTLTDKQKALLLDDFGVGKTVIGYNPAKVKQELSKMR